MPLEPSKRYDTHDIDLSIFQFINNTIVTKIRVCYWKIIPSTSKFTSMSMVGVQQEIINLNVMRYSFYYQEKNSRCIEAFRSYSFIQKTRSFKKENHSSVRLMRQVGNHT